MPCDSYTEVDYFKTINKMVKYVKEDIANLI